MGKLEGKVAIVTGASMGIGKAIAKAYAREGAKVVICSSKSVNELEETAAEIKADGGTVEHFITDISFKSSVEQLAGFTIDKFNRIDILVNNASINLLAPLLDFKEEDFDRIMAVNLRGTFLCTQTAAKIMLKQKTGVIVNISSICGLNFNLQGGYVAYSSSKAGINTMTRVSARELGPYVRVNCIAPGAIETRLSYRFETKEEVKEWLRHTSCSQRIGSSQEVANVAVFLASDDASYVNGQVISVDGGRFDGM